MERSFIALKTLWFEFQFQVDNLTCTQVFNLTKMFKMLYDLLCLYIYSPPTPVQCNQRSVTAITENVGPIHISDTTLGVFTDLNFLLKRWCRCSWNSLCRLRSLVFFFLTWKWLLVQSILPTGIFLVKCKFIDNHVRILLVIVLLPSLRSCYYQKPGWDTTRHEFPTQLLVPRCFPKQQPGSWSRAEQPSSSVVPCHFKRTGTSTLHQFALFCVKCNYYASSCRTTLYWNYVHKHL